MMRRIIGKFYAWLIWREYRKSERSPEIWMIVRREIGAVHRSVAAFDSWQKSEQDILSERLGRRYDLGMALNESANRAIAAKQAARQELPPHEQLTSKQKLALKLQKEHLQRIVDRS